jgi:hypothetical protein
MMNDIYLNTWAQGILDFTPSDSLILLGIAEQNIASGGNGVFGARVMLGVEGNQMESNKIVNDEVKVVNNIGLIYPNPVNDNASIDYSLPVGATALLNIYNITGALIKSYQLESENNHFEFSTIDLNAGVYLYNISFGNGEVINSNKLIIIK